MSNVEDEFGGIFNMGSDLPGTTTEPAKSESKQERAIFKDFKIEEVELNDQFKKALDIIENTKRSIFITGSAGSGKSTLIKYFATTTKKRFVMLAPTGIAATNICGQTIHSFFRFPPKIITPNMISVPKYADVYRKLEAILIDEISMVRVDMLDAIDIFLKKTRNSKLPFGGVQMILIGDLHQLSPVITNNEERQYLTKYRSPYFFDSQVLTDCPIEKIMLKTIYRQKDPVFISMLNRMKNNTMTQDDYDYVNNICFREFDRNEKTLHLCTTNNIVDFINDDELSKIPEKIHRYEAKIEGKFNPKNTTLPELLEVKVGVQIIMMNNDIEGRWKNGTLGVIDSIKENGDIWIKINESIHKAYRIEVESFEYSFDPQKHHITHKPGGKFIQFGMKLAYALSIHKAQGQTFNRIHINIGRGIFASGQIYVAFSRCTTLEGITIDKRIGPADNIFDERLRDYLTEPTL